MGFFDKLQSKIELYRLEQKYARRKNRTVFSSGAQYVDGEYVYNTAAVDSWRSPTTNTSADVTASGPASSSTSDVPSTAAETRNVEFGTNGNNGASAASNRRRSVLWTPPQNQRRWS